MKDTKILVVATFLVCTTATVTAEDRYFLPNGPANWNENVNWNSDPDGFGNIGVPGTNDQALVGANRAGTWQAQINGSDQNVYRLFIGEGGNMPEGIVDLLGGSLNIRQEVNVAGGSGALGTLHWAGGALTFKNKAASGDVTDNNISGSFNLGGRNEDGLLRDNFASLFFMPPGASLYLRRLSLGYSDYGNGALTILNGQHVNVWQEFHFNSGYQGIADLYWSGGDLTFKRDPVSADNGNLNVNGSLYIGGRNERDLPPGSNIAVFDLAPDAQLYLRDLRMGYSDGGNGSLTIGSNQHVNVWNELVLAGGYQGRASLDRQGGTLGFKLDPDNPDVTFNNIGGRLYIGGRNEQDLARGSNPAELNLPTGESLYLQRLEVGYSDFGNGRLTIASGQTVNVWNEMTLAGGYQGMADLDWQGGALSFKANPDGGNTNQNITGSLHIGGRNEQDLTRGDNIAELHMPPGADLFVKRLILAYGDVGHAALSVSNGQHVNVWDEMILAGANQGMATLNWQPGTLGFKRDPENPDVTMNNISGRLFIGGRNEQDLARGSNPAELNLPTGESLYLQRLEMGYSDFGNGRLSIVSGQTVNVWNEMTLAGGYQGMADIDWQGGALTFKADPAGGNAPANITGSLHLGGRNEQGLPRGSNIVELLLPPDADLFVKRLILGQGDESHGKLSIGVGRRVNVWDELILAGGYQAMAALDWQTGTLGFKLDPDSPDVSMNNIGGRIYVGGRNEQDLTRGANMIAVVPPPGESLYLRRLELGYGDFGNGSLAISDGQAVNVWNEMILAGGYQGMADLDWQGGALTFKADPAGGNTPANITGRLVLGGRNEQDLARGSNACHLAMPPNAELRIERMTLGSGDFGNGEITIDPGHHVTCDEDFFVAAHQLAAGAVNQNGGDVLVGRDLYLGNGATSEGIYYFHGGALTVLDEFTIRAGGFFDWTAGEFSVRYVRQTLDNPGTGVLSPGLSAGRTDIDGDYTQGSNATLKIELGGTNQWEHDYVNLTGAARLDGTLSVSLIDGFNPQGDETFVILSAVGGITNNLTLTGFDGDLLVQGNDLLLTNVRVPEFVNTRITRQPGAVTLNWDSFSNRTYTVFATESLLGTQVWLAVTNGIPPTPPINALQFPVPDTVPRRYYLIRAD